MISLLLNVVPPCRAFRLATTSFGSVREELPVSPSSQDELTSATHATTSRTEPLILGTRLVRDFDALTTSTENNRSRENEYVVVTNLRLETFRPEATADGRHPWPHGKSSASRQHVGDRTRTLERIQGEASHLIKPHESDWTDDD